MDGYIRANTDDKGKIIDIWDEWYRDPDLGDYMSDCGIDCYFQDYTLKPNSLILIIFNYKSEVTESYMYGKEYDEWIEIEHEIVLIEDYNYRNEEVEMYIGEDLQNAHIEGYIDGLREVYRAIVDNEDLPERTNPHYLDGRIDKQNIVLGIIETMLEHADK